MIRVLREDFPDLPIFGVGGEHLRAAGVETLFDIEALNVVGLVEVLAKVPSGLLMARRLLRAARERGARVAVLIDAPGFNLPFARWAKQAGLRVVYYVSPQIWAWRQNRVHKVARRVDKMLTLFPFEVPFYTARRGRRRIRRASVPRLPVRLAGSQPGRPEAGIGRQTPHRRPAPRQSPSGSGTAAGTHARGAGPDPRRSARGSRRPAGGADRVGHGAADCSRVFRPPYGGRSAEPDGAMRGRFRPRRFRARRLWKPV